MNLKIYDMVVARFLVVLSAPAISEQLSVKTSINGELFRAKAENIKQLGWRELYEEETQTKDTIKAKRKYQLKEKNIRLERFPRQKNNEPIRALAYGRYTDRSDG